MTVQIKKGAALGTLSLTPLIDVVFLLLIFFLVASRFAQEDRQLDVVLPSASEAMPLTSRPREVTVNIDQQGRFVIDNRVLAADELADVLRQAAANNPVHQSVFIRADKRVAFEYVATAMNLCNVAGIRDYKVMTAGDGAGQ